MAVRACPGVPDPLLKTLAAFAAGVFFLFTDAIGKCYNRIVPKDETISRCFVPMELSIRERKGQKMNCTTLNIFQNVLSAYNAQPYGVIWGPDEMAFALDEFTEVTVKCNNGDYHTCDAYEVRVVKFDEDDRVIGVMTEPVDIEKSICHSTSICGAIEKCESRFASRRKED